MELLKEIPEKNQNKDMTYELRKAARAVLLNDAKEMALLYVSKGNYHKLPGGGIEEGEDIYSALKREVKEEVGAEIEVLDEIGLIIEYRDGFGKYPTGQIQLSYCFYAKVVGKVGETSFSENELANGFELKWVPFNQGLELLKNDSSEDPLGQFIHKRDLAFIEKAKEIIDS